MNAALLSGTVAALLGFFLLRKASFGIADPLVYGYVPVIFSAALLAYLCDASLIPQQKFLLFMTVLASFLVGARFSIAFCSGAELRTSIITALNRFGAPEIQATIFMTVCLTAVLAFLAILEGAAGDSRQGFARVFRPLITLQAGMFPISLLLLLSPKLIRWKVVVWLFFLVVLSIPFSGKSILVPLAFWLGLRFFLEGRKPSVTVLVSLALLVVAGMAFMGVIAYSAGQGGRGILAFVFFRMWMSGDVYIYAYQQNALDLIRHDYHVSFVSYMMHPFTSLFGVRAYDKPLGSMLMSEVLRSDVLTGPNPQLPVLLDFFYGENLLMDSIMAGFLGMFCLGVRSVGVWLSRSRSRHLAVGGVAAAIFSPATGFTDTSQVTISIIGIAGWIFLAAFSTLFLAPRHLILSRN